ncbi:MAG TPA: hypothetical protein VGR26_15830, partial [Acidimicrobiales bacterium]|nr:hypothetical protein [Acidimicrobiales bacterium]
KVRVTEQLIRLESGEWLRKETKTAAGVRSITISPETAKILAAHIERYTAPALDALVFPNSTGNPLMSSSFWQHHFQPALRAAGLSCRFHDLRHQRGPGHRRGRPPQGHPGPHGPLLDQRDPRPIRPPLAGAR